MPSAIQIRRSDAVQAVVNTYIGQEGDIAGMLIKEANFAELYDRIDKLRVGSRSGSAWLKGLDKWEDCVSTAIITFRDTNGISHLQGPGKETDYEWGTQRSDYIRLFKWAVMQGAIYANLYNLGG